MTELYEIAKVIELMNKSIKSGYLFILTVFIVLSVSIYQLAGCGGGSGGSSSSSGTSGGTVSGSAKYYINVTLKFPENTSRDSFSNNLLTMINVHEDMW